MKNARYEIRVKRNREEVLFIRKETQIKGKFTKNDFEMKKLQIKADSE